MTRAAGLWRYAATAVLGFSRRQDPPVVRAPWLERSASSYEAPLAGEDVLQLGRSAQLPPFGRGNGIDALFWTPLARLDAVRVDDVLRALAEEDIAGWVAAVPRRSTRDGSGPHDLWVASLRLDAAQDVLMRVLSAPARP